MEQIYLQSIGINDFKDIISTIFEEKLKSKFSTDKEKSDTNFLGRLEVAKLLKISLPTLHDWTKRGLLKSYRIGSRVIYKREEIEQSLIEVKNIKYRRE